MNSKAKNVQAAEAAQAVKPPGLKGLRLVDGGQSKVKSVKVSQVLSLT